MTQKARRDQGFILIKNETATLPHREKPVLGLGEELQSMILKKYHENSHFLTSEFHSRCKNMFS